MKSFFIALTLFISFSVSADQMKEMAKAHLRVLDEKNKEMAHLLVLASYMDIIQSGQAPDLKLSYDSLQDIIHSSQDALLDMELVTGDSTERLQQITKSIVSTEVAMQKWLTDRAYHTESNARFREVMNTPTDLCTEDQFSRSMALVSLTENSGLDFSRLKGRFEISIQARFNDDGTPESLERSNGPSGGSIEDAAGFAAAAGAATLNNYLTGAALQSITVPGVGYAAAAYLAVKITAAYLKAKKAEKGLKELYKLNEKIFENMNLEFNVRKYYNSYCKGVQKAYLEGSAAVRDENLSNSQLEKMVLDLENDLLVKGVDLAQPPLSDNEEIVSKYFLYRIYERALTQREDTDFLNAKKSRAYTDFVELRKSTYENIRSIFLSRMKVDYSEQETTFIYQMKVLQEREIFKHSFQSLYLRIFHSQDPVLKSQTVLEMENLLNFYKYSRVNPLPEEISLITTYEEIVGLLKEML